MKLSVFFMLMFVLSILLIIYEIISNTITPSLIFVVFECIIFLITGVRVANSGKDFQFLRRSTVFFICLVICLLAAITIPFFYESNLTFFGEISLFTVCMFLLFKAIDLKKLEAKK